MFSLTTREKKMSTFVWGATKKLSQQYVHHFNTFDFAFIFKYFTIAHFSMYTLLQAIATIIVRHVIDMVELWVISVNPYTYST